MQQNAFLSTTSNKRRVCVNVVRTYIQTAHNDSKKGQPLTVLLQLMQFGMSEKLNNAYKSN